MLYKYEYCVQWSGTISFEITYIRGNHFWIFALVEVPHAIRIQSHNQVNYVLCFDKDNLKHSEMIFLELLEQIFKIILPC